MSSAVDQACRAAEAAFDAYRATSPTVRASFLEAIAAQLEQRAEAIVAAAHAESALPLARLNGELGRTTGQLRFFAANLREGSWLGVQMDSALRERKPAPRPDLRLQHIALGPVAVFGASNFPLAFSVAGGDTASALGAGCPVVCKAHSAHPQTARLAAEAIMAAVQVCNLPAGVFALVEGSVGAELVQHPAIQAVGFTGSRHGGLALIALAQARPQPIPFYAEMSSINPVLLFPGALTERAEAIGREFIASLTLGVGQFCTNPGLTLLPEGPDAERFLGAAAAALHGVTAQPMLTSGMHKSYCEAVARWQQHARLQCLAAGQPGDDSRCAGAALFCVSAEDFLADARLQGEVFGPAGLVVRCRDAAQIAQVLQQLEGQLTIAVHATAADHAAVAQLLPLLERKAGRLLFNGFGTGVEVAHAMVHGGPYPATSDSRSTSVGALAIARFLRPVCYQNVPEALLPPALQEANPWQLPRRRDGQPL